MLPNRTEAGRQLAKKLLPMQHAPDTCVVSLTRGGVVVGYEIAGRLNLPMDILIVRKIGMVDNPEYAIGAISEHGEIFIDNTLIREYRVPWDYIEREIQHQKKHLEECRLSFSGLRNNLNLSKKTVILVDDGLATGHTMHAAIQDVKKQGAATIVLAVPVGPKETILSLKPFVDRIVVLTMPRFFFSVGHHYTYFPQVETAEVTTLLKQTHNYSNL